MRTGRAWHRLLAGVSGWLLAVAAVVAPASFGGSAALGDAALPAPGQFFPTRGRALDNVEIAANTTISVRVLGVGGVPLSDVGSVALNIAAKGTTGAGPLKVFPSDAAEPAAVAMSYRTEVYAANMVTAKVGADGQIKVANRGTGAVRVTLDVHGYTQSQPGTTSGSTYTALNPSRIVNNVSVPAFGNYQFTPLGKGGVPGSGVEAVTLTVRASSASAGTLRVYPAGDVFPGDATIDYAANLSLQNFVIAKLGTDGMINIHNLGGGPVTVWVDAGGYFTKQQPPGPTLRPLQPARLAGNVTVAAGAGYTLAPLGKGGVPSASVAAVSVSVTAKSTSAGALKAYPSGVAEPATHTVGYDANIAATGSTVAKLGADGKVIIRNTGTAAAVISVDVFGYFRKGLYFTESTATPADSVWPEGVRANSPTPTLRAAAATTQSGTVNYAFEVAPALSNTPVATGTADAVPAGQTATWTVASGTLTNPGAYRFRIKASDGTDTFWTAWRWLLIDAPNPPTGLATNLDDPAQPLLAGTVSRPSGGPVTGRFYLYDQSGAPVGPSPLGEGEVNDGKQVVLQVPKDLVSAGSTYTWRLEACIQTACTAKSGPVTFTVPHTPPPPATQTLTINADAITIKTAKLAPTACAGSGCPLADSAVIQAGGTGDQAVLSWLQPDLRTLPAGAKITSAVLALGSPSCGQGACTPAEVVRAYPAARTPESATTGADLNAELPTDSAAETTVAERRLELAELLSVWRDDPTENHGLVLKSDAGEPITFGSPAGGATLTIKYVPPAPPGPVEIKARPGDGGLLATWSPPDDPGGAVQPTYELQVLDNSGAVARQIQTEELSQIITGLSNGATYRAQVRAKTTIGTGPWTATGNLTPQAVPGGAQQYLDAVVQSDDVQDDLLDGTATTVEGALSPKSQQNTIRNFTYSRADDLIEWHRQAAQRNHNRSTGNVTIQQSLVSSFPDGSITVHALTEGDVTTTVADESVQDKPLAEADYRFTAGPGQHPQLTDVVTGPVGDAVSSTGEVNAYTAEQRRGQPAADEAPPAMPLDADGWPILEPIAAQTKAVSPWDAADWAVDKVYKRAPRYPNDCTNFVSKALRFGGRYPFHGYSPYITTLNKYWYQYQGSLTSRSYSWSASTPFMFHWWRFGRTTAADWRTSWSQIRRGDVILWDHDGGTGSAGHVSIVSLIMPRTKEIFYTQHSKDYRYRSLAEGLSSVYKQHPNFKWYVFRPRK